MLLRVQHEIWVNKIYRIRKIVFTVIYSILLPNTITDSYLQLDCLVSLRHACCRLICTTAQTPFHWYTSRHNGVLDLLWKFIIYLDQSFTRLTATLLYMVKNKDHWRITRKNRFAFIKEEALSFCHIWDMTQWLRVIYQKVLSSNHHQTVMIKDFNKDPQLHRCILSHIWIKMPAKWANLFISMHL